MFLSSLGKSTEVSLLQQAFHEDKSSYQVIFHSDRTMIVAYYDISRKEPISFVKYTYMSSLQKEQFFNALDEINSDSLKKARVEQMLIMPNKIYVVKSGTEVNYNRFSAFEYNIEMHFLPNQFLTTAPVFFQPNTKNGYLKNQVAAATNIFFGIFKHKNNENLANAKTESDLTYLANQFELLNRMIDKTLSTLIEIDQLNLGYVDLKPENIVLNQNGESFLIDIDGLFKKGYFQYSLQTPRYEIPRVKDSNDIYLQDWVDLRFHREENYALNENIYRLGKTYLTLLMPLLQKLHTQLKTEPHLSSLKKIGSMREFIKTIDKFLHLESTKETNYTLALSNIRVLADQVFGSSHENTVSDGIDFSNTFEHLKIFTKALSLDQQNRETAQQQLYNQIISRKRCELLDI
jgi:hypothetical protein